MYIDDMTLTYGVTAVGVTGTAAVFVKLIVKEGFELYVSIVKNYRQAKAELAEDKAEVAAK